MDIFDHYENDPTAIFIPEVGNPDEGVILKSDEDGTVLVMAYSDGGDSWHGARVTRDELLRALGVTA